MRDCKTCPVITCAYRDNYSQKNCIVDIKWDQLMNKPEKRKKKIKDIIDIAVGAILIISEIAFLTIAFLKGFGIF